MTAVQPDLFDADPALAPGEVVLVADWAETRDSWGQVQFTALWLPGRWWALDQPAGQVFLGNPEEHAERWAENGYAVRVESDGWSPS